MMWMNECDEKATTVEEKNSDRGEDPSRKGHLQLVETSSIFIKAFPFAERKVFKMKIADELSEGLFTFEGYIMARANMLHMNTNSSS